MKISSQDWKPEQLDFLSCDPYVNTLHISKERKHLWYLFGEEISCRSTTELAPPPPTG